MRRTINLGFNIGLLISTFACDQTNVNEPSGCLPVTESVYVNTRYPHSIKPFDPNAARVLTFEGNFADTVSVLVDNTLIMKRYLQTESNGLAGRIEIKVRPNALITMIARTNCARFELRDGYKYLYINKRGWTVAYSNFGRGYL